MIDKAVYCAGTVIVFFGGLLLFVTVIALLLGAVGECWIWASNKWRRICKAESLIHEYRGNRDSYLVWKKEHGYPEAEEEHHA